MLAIVCQAIFFDFLGNPGFLEKGVRSEIHCMVNQRSGRRDVQPCDFSELNHRVSFGAKADGKADDTAAIQKALDTTGKLGGVVRLPAGKFLVAGSFKIPVGVVLAGSNQASSL